MKQVKGKTIYPNYTEEQLNKAFEDFFYKKEEDDCKRHVSIITWKDGLELFNKALKEEANKLNIKLCGGAGGSSNGS